MSFVLPNLGMPLPFDDVIDVRSPAEFAEDHVPGAINLPALSNEERARVGTIYTQDSPFAARKIGAALVARNVAGHLEGVLSNRSKGWRPLVYCWRGGQRSGSVATILRQIGWQANVLEGGYRSYRRAVKAALYDREFTGRIILLDGYTGTGKTEILTHLANLGIQTLDLEAMACHRGSLFGEMPGGQPSQKAFETRLAATLAEIDFDRPLVIEAESNKIGDRIIPPTLWNAMRGAASFRLTTSPRIRANYTAKMYADVCEIPKRLTQILDALSPYHPTDRIAVWKTLAEIGSLAGIGRRSDDTPL